MTMPAVFLPDECYRCQRPEQTQCLCIRTFDDFGCLSLVGFFFGFSCFSFVCGSPALLEM